MPRGSSVGWLGCSRTDRWPGKPIVSRHRVTTLHLRAGRPYRLEVHNAASGGHDFTAPEFFAAARIAPADAAKVAGGLVQFGPDDPFA